MALPENWSSVMMILEWLCVAGIVFGIITIAKSAWEELKTLRSTHPRYSSMPSSTCASASPAKASSTDVDTPEAAAATAAAAAAAAAAATASTMQARALSGSSNSSTGFALASERPASMSGSESSIRSRSCSGGGVGAHATEQPQQRPAQEQLEPGNLDLSTGTGGDPAAAGPAVCQSANPVDLLNEQNALDKLFDNVGRITSMLDQQREGTTGSMSERNADGTTQEVWRMVPPGIRERYETLLQEVNASYARLDKSLREYQTKENDQAPWNDCAFGRYRGGCHGTTRDRQSGARVSNHGAEEECLEGAVNSVGVASGECGHYEAGSKALHNDMLDDLNSSLGEMLKSFGNPLAERKGDDCSSSSPASKRSSEAAPRSRAHEDGGREIREDEALAAALSSANIRGQSLGIIGNGEPCIDRHGAEPHVGTGSDDIHVGSRSSFGNSRGWGNADRIENASRYPRNAERGAASGVMNARGAAHEAAHGVTSYPSSSNRGGTSSVGCVVPSACSGGSTCNPATTEPLGVRGCTREEFTSPNVGKGNNGKSSNSVFISGSDEDCQRRKTELQQSPQLYQEHCYNNARSSALPASSAARSPFARVPPSARANGHVDGSIGSNPAASGLCERHSPQADSRRSSDVTRRVSSSSSSISQSQAILASDKECCFPPPLPRPTRGGGVVQEARAFAPAQHLAVLGALLRGEGNDGAAESDSDSEDESGVGRTGSGGQGTQIPSPR